MTRLRVGVFAGGRSAEHEVSVASAEAVLRAIDRDRFEPSVVYIDRDGRWMLPNGPAPRLEDGATLAGLLGVIVLAYFGQIRLLSTLLPSVDPRVDILVTGIALMGGADRIAGWVKAPDSDGGSQEATPTPIQVTGTLTLEPGSGKPPVP